MQKKGGDVERKNWEEGPRQKNKIPKRCSREYLALRKINSLHETTPRKIMSGKREGERGSVGALVMGAATGLQTQPGKGSCVEKRGREKLGGAKGGTQTLPLLRGNGGWCACEVFNRKL